MEEYILYPEFVKRTASIDHLLATNVIDAAKEELLMKEASYYYDLEIPSVRCGDYVEIHGILNNCYCLLLNGMIRIYLQKPFFTKQKVFVLLKKERIDETERTRRNSSFGKKNRRVNHMY